MAFRFSDFTKGESVVLYGHTHKWEGVIAEVDPHEKFLELSSSSESWKNVRISILYSEIVAVSRKKK